MRARLAAVIAMALCVPSLAFAFPFGGAIGQIIFCYNDAVYANVGPPRGGPYIWTPSTRTYKFGPPLRTGQWLLGLAAPPYYCIVSKQPIIVWSGILMTMEGSSGAPAPAYSPGSRGGGLGSGGSGSGSGGSGGTNGGTPSNAIRILVSEVYPYPDAAHGSSWIEFYNATLSDIDLSQWVVKTASTTLAFPSGTTVAAHGYLVLTSDAAVRTKWSIASTAPVVVSDALAGGFAAPGDDVFLDGSDNLLVDSVSWGSNGRAFSPPAALPATGRSLIRTTLSRDTDSAQDWVVTSAPTPGR